MNQRTRRGAEVKECGRPAHWVGTIWAGRPCCLRRGADGDVGAPRGGLDSRGFFDHNPSTGAGARTQAAGWPHGRLPKAARKGETLW